MSSQLSKGEQQQMAQRLPKLLDPQTLYRAIDEFPAGLRILDCTFRPGQHRLTSELLEGRAYGNFEQQARLDLGFRQSRFQFLDGHIPSAVHFHLGLATFSSQFEKFAFYPPKVFEEYARLLGLDSGDHLVLYGRGQGLGAMLFASRVYWVFKSYGHEGGLSLLNGGFDGWLRHKLPFEIGKQEDPIFATKKGNWTAKADPSTRLVAFEQLVKPATDGGKGAKLTGQFTLLDARPRINFEGNESSLDPSGPTPPGSHLPGAINIPANEVVDPETGTIRSAKEVKSLVNRSGLDLDSIQRAKGKPLVTMCNAGNQASLLAIALETRLGLDNIRVYNGSLLEVQARAPELISE